MSYRLSTCLAVHCSKIFAPKMEFLFWLRRQRNGNFGIN